MILRIPVTTHEDMLAIYGEHRDSCAPNYVNLSLVQRAVWDIFASVPSSILTNNESNSSRQYINFEVRVVGTRYRKPRLLNSGTERRFLDTLKPYIIKGFTEVFNDPSFTLLDGTFDNFSVPFSISEAKKTITTGYFHRFGYTNNGEFFLLPDSSSSYFYYKPYYKIALSPSGEILKCIPKIDNEVLDETLIDSVLLHRPGNNNNLPAIHSMRLTEIVTEYVDLCCRYGIDYKNLTTEDIELLNISYQDKNGDQ